MAKTNEKCMQNADTNFLETKNNFKNFLKHIGFKALLLD